eukprot:3681140-Rhodomonas_salina.1
MVSAICVIEDVIEAVSSRVDSLVKNSWHHRVVGGRRRRHRERSCRSPRLAPRLGGSSPCLRLSSQWGVVGSRCSGRWGLLPSEHGRHVSPLHLLPRALDVVGDQLRLA